MKNIKFIRKIIIVLILFYGIYLMVNGKSDIAGPIFFVVFFQFVFELTSFLYKEYKMRKS